jgi:transposase
MAKLPIMPNAENCSLAELEVAAQSAPSKRSHIRLTAIRALLLGIGPEPVAALFSITRRTLYNWIKRFNEQGIDGLIDRWRPGRPRKISPEQGVYYRELLEHPQQVDQTYWTAKKFHGYISTQLEQEIGYSTVVRWLHENYFTLKVPQSWPERQNEAERQAFLEQLQNYLRATEIDIWYLDEMGVEGDPLPRRRWAQKGAKIRVPYYGEHLRMKVTGMICPRTGEFYALEFTHTDSEVFQAFLNHANKDLNLERRRNLLICDNATWHKKKSLDWGHFEPVYLPPYSPDLNPIERLWLLIKAEWFTDFIAKNREQLIERLDQALLWVINRKEHNQQTCSIRNYF